MGCSQQIASPEQKSCQQVFHVLLDKWKLYAHLPHDTNWSISSYKEIALITNVEQAIAISETLPEKMIKNCMLFLMRSNVKPIWEDPNNKEGGCLSYKIAIKNVARVWRELSYILVGESICKSSSTNITGITISPKKNFCIIKIWFSNCNNQNPETINYSDIEGFESSGCLFKKHL
tara:strand:- start:42 stop:569 length:528 start_codon:yes stop_codon:yes gene_type:complete